MTLHLTLPAPKNLYCNTCLISTEHGPGDGKADDWTEGWEE